MNNTIKCPITKIDTSTNDDDDDDDGRGDPTLSANYPSIKQGTIHDIFPATTRVKASLKYWRNYRVKNRSDGENN